MSELLASEAFYSKVSISLEMHNYAQCLERMEP